MVQRNILVFYHGGNKDPRGPGDGAPSRYLWRRKLDLDQDCSPSASSVRNVNMAENVGNILGDEDNKQKGSGDGG